jgi:hypothetical protein
MPHLPKTLPKTTKNNQKTTKTTTTIKSDGNQMKW